VREEEDFNYYRFYGRKKEELGGGHRGACNEKQWSVEGGDGGKKVGYEKFTKATHRDIG